MHWHISQPQQPGFVLQVGGKKESEAESPAQAARTASFRDTVSWGTASAGHLQNFRGNPTSPKNPQATHPVPGDRVSERGRGKAVKAWHGGC